MKMIAVFAMFAVCTAAHAEEVLSGPQEVLSEALRVRYETETLQDLDLTIRGPNGVRGKRSVEIATKLYDGRLYVLGRFTSPQRLRGTAFLAIEDKDASDYFVYLPAFRKVRRVSSFQRSDPWFETDLSFEDVERHYVEDYTVERMISSDWESELVDIIEAKPRYESRYALVRFFVARIDRAILRIEYFVHGRTHASKTITAPRASIIREGESLVPGRIVARNVDQGSETIVETRRIVFDPRLRRGFFNSSRLEIRDMLPFATAHEKDR